MSAAPRRGDDRRRSWCSSPPWQSRSSRSHSSGCCSARRGRDLWSDLSSRERTRGAAPVARVLASGPRRCRSCSACPSRGCSLAVDFVGRPLGACAGAAADGGAAGRRRRRPALRVRARRPRRRAALRLVRSPAHVQHRWRDPRRDVRRDAVPRDHRRGRSPVDRHSLRGRGGDARSRALDDVPARHAAVPRTVARRRSGAGVGPRARRVRRHDHVRRQHPGTHADDAARGVPRARVEPRERDRPEPRAHRGLDRRAGRRCATAGSRRLQDEPRGDASRRDRSAPSSSTSTSRPATTRSSRSSDRTARGRRRSSASSPGCCASTRATSGSTTWCSTSRAAARTSCRERRSIGVVFQDYLLFPFLDARENVAFGLRSRGVAKRDGARRELTSGYDESASAITRDQKPRALSGGQAQRVALARALAGKPAAPAPRRTARRARCRHAGRDPTRSPPAPRRRSRACGSS